MLTILDLQYMMEEQVKTQQCCILISIRHRNKLKDDFFKQKCKTLLRKKMEFLINHKNKTENRQKRVIRCNVNKKNNQILDELLGDNMNFVTSARKTKKKKIIQIKRSVSTNVNNRISSHITSLKTKQFSKVEIVSKNNINRKASYCNESESMKVDLFDRKLTMSKLKTDTLGNNQREYFKWNKLSINESELASTQVSTINLQNDFARTNSVCDSENIFNLQFKSYVTPIKKKRRIYPANSSSSKYIETTPMMIRSMNTSSQKVYQSGLRSQRDLPYTTSDPMVYSQT